MVLRSSSKWVAVISVALAVGAMLEAGAAAGIMAPPPSKYLKAVAGVVNSNGSIISGSGFTVAHNATGNYTISTPQFTRFPALLVSPAFATGQPQLMNVQSEVCTNSAGCSFIIEIFAGNQPNDSAFSFYATSASV